MSQSVRLSTGALMPLMGFGTFRLTGYDNIFPSLDAALACGYRSIDTAQFYNNESAIGQALSILMPRYGLQRKDLFITSKVSTVNMGIDKVRESVEKSLEDLKMDYADLFLVHYPKPSWLDSKDPKVKDVRRECWLELEKLHAEGKLKSIGVSNYELRHLDEMTTYASVQPAVNQCEFHPHYCRREFVPEIRRRGIHFQAFTSLGRNNLDLMSEPLVVQLAQKYGVKPSQILLAWPMAQGIGVIPKSTNPERIKENFEAVNVKMSEEDVEEIWKLHRNVNYSVCTPWEVI